MIALEKRKENTREIKREKRMENTLVKDWNLQGYRTGTTLRVQWLRLRPTNARG